MHFNDAGCFDPRPQDVLNRGLVLFGPKPVQVVQEAAERIGWVRPPPQHGHPRDGDKIRHHTHYFAESLSWYSLDLAKHCWTPPSTQSRFMAANSSSENGSVSSIRETTSMTILASVCEVGTRNGIDMLQNGYMPLVGAVPFGLILKTYYTLKLNDRFSPPCLLAGTIFQGWASPSEWPPEIGWCCCTPPACTA